MARAKHQSQPKDRIRTEGYWNEERLSMEVIQEKPIRGIGATRMEEGRLFEQDETIDDTTCIFGV
jgi:hypothetical protein